MAQSRADRGDDAFTHTGQNGLLAGTADELLNVGTHGDTGLGYQLDTVLGHSGHRRRVDNLGVDRCLHSLQHVAASQVDGGGGAEIKVHIGFAGRDEGLHHVGDIAASQIVGFQLVLRQLQPCLGGVNHVIDYHAGRYFAETHKHKLNQRGVNTRHQRLEPQTYGYQIKEDDE